MYQTFNSHIQYIKNGDTYFPSDTENPRFLPLPWHQTMVWEERRITFSPNPKVHCHYLKVCFWGSQFPDLSKKTCWTKWSQYEFSIAALTNGHKLSGLNASLLSYSCVGQKSNVGVTGLKSGFTTQGYVPFPAPGDFPHFLDYDPLPPSSKPAVFHLSDCRLWSPFCLTITGKGALLFRTRVIRLGQLG